MKNGFIFATLVALMSALSPSADSSPLELDRVPLDQFLRAISGQYEVDANQDPSCPALLNVSVTSSYHDGAAIEFNNGLEGEERFVGIIERIDGREYESGNPHWNEIYYNRVRRRGLSVVVEERRCRVGAFFITHCSRYRPNNRPQFRVRANALELELLNPNRFLSFPGFSRRISASSCRYVR